MQDDPAFCGLASVAMVLNALSIDPRRPWKGSWRIFHEHLLDCCVPLAQVQQKGITLSQAACLARCNGAHVDLVYHRNCTLEEFRADTIASCSGSAQHVIVSYSRKGLSQTGDGHFSPLGGYHAGKDAALILDTARFKYAPHWVSLQTLHDAMAASDPATGRCRGYLRVTASPRRDSTLFTHNISTEHWRQVDSFAKADAPALVGGLASSLPPEQALQQLVQAMPLQALQYFLAVRALSLGEGDGVAAEHGCCQAESCHPWQAAEQMLRELHSLPVFCTVTQALQHAGKGPAAQGQAASLQIDHADRACMLLLLLPKVAPWPQAAALQMQEELGSLPDMKRTPILAMEVDYLCEQWAQLDVLAA